MLRPKVEKCIRSKWVQVISKQVEGYIIPPVEKHVKSSLTDLPRWKDSRVISVVKGGGGTSTFMWMHSPPSTLTLRSQRVPNFSISAYRKLTTWNWWKFFFVCDTSCLFTNSAISCTSRLPWFLTVEDIPSGQLSAPMKQLSPVQPLWQSHVYPPSFIVLHAPCLQGSSKHWS